MDEYVLIRIPATATTVLVPEIRDGKVTGAHRRVQKRNQGIVVAVGPGRVSDSGNLIPIDPHITPGATVVFPTATVLAESEMPDELSQSMRDEGLFFIAANTIICVIRPEGLRVAERA